MISMKQECDIEYNCEWKQKGSKCYWILKQIEPFSIQPS